jgi:hypothetical protein
MIVIAGVTISFVAVRPIAIRGGSLSGQHRVKEPTQPRQDVTVLV